MNPDGGDIADRLDHRDARLRRLGQPLDRPRAELLPDLVARLARGVRALEEDEASVDQNSDLDARR